MSLWVNGLLIILKKMTLLVNGCSFTYGDELPNHEEERFSTHLGKLLNIDVVNAAWPGSSNERIWRTTKEHLFLNRNITKCLILWSDFARVENVHLESNMLNYQGGKVKKGNKLYDEGGKFLMPDPFFQFSPSRLNTMPWKILKDQYADYYSNVYTNETGICKTFNYIVDILETCKLLNVEYYQGWFHQGNEYTMRKSFNDYNANVKGDRLVPIKEYVDARLSRLMGRQRIGFDNDSMSFNEFTEKNNLDKMPEGHPGPKAHEEYAKYLYENFMR